MYNAGANLSCINVTAGRVIQVEDTILQKSLQIGHLSVLHEEIVHRNEGLLDGPPEVAEVRLPAAEHGGEAEDEVALPDVVADAVAVHDEGAEAHEGLGGAAHLDGGGKIQIFSKVTSRKTLDV